MTAPPLPILTASATLKVSALQAADLDALAQLEAICHGHPWGRDHFADALQHCNLMLGVWRLDAPPQAHKNVGHSRTHSSVEALATTTAPALQAYVVALPGVQEMHILNVSTAPAVRRQGLARLLITHVFHAATARGDEAVWLEVRVSNQAAIALYTAMGFEHISVRKDYYPLRNSVREDALVMRWTVQTSPCKERIITAPTAEQESACPHL